MLLFLEQVVPEGGFRLHATTRQARIRAGPLFGSINVNGLAGLASTGQHDDRKRLRAPRRASVSRDEEFPHLENTIPDCLDEPLHHIGINACGQLLPDRAIELAARCAVPVSSQLCHPCTSRFAIRPIYAL